MYPRPAAAFSLASLLISLFTGCAGPAPRAAPSPNATRAAAAPSSFDALQKGLTAVEVRKLVGEPQEIKPFKDGELHSEVWVYRRLISEEVRPVTVTTREVPQINPLTGVMGTSTEPVIINEFIKVSETLELLMIEGRLAEWKRKPQIDRRID